MVLLLQLELELEVEPLLGRSWLQAVTQTMLVGMEERMTRHR